MKLLVASFEVENDLAEYNLRNEMIALGVKYMKTLPDTEHLKDDKHYMDLVKAKKEHEKNLYKYADSKRNG